MWLDYDTPVIDEVMNATYNGKISVNSSYREAPSNMIMAKDFTIDSKTGEGDMNPDTGASSVILFGNIIEISKRSLLRTP
mgnify:FL=1